MIDLLAWAERFIATPSVSRDGNGAIAQVAAELLREVGLQPRFIPARHDGVEHFCVVADAGPQVAAGPDHGGLLLLTHLDTVPPGPTEEWTATGGDPFRPVRDGDRLYGLGSADAKVDLVCKAAALQQLKGAKLRRPLRIVGTWAEEIGMLGARAFVASGGARGFRHALIGEPSELVAIRAHKGYAVYRARVELTALPLERTGRSVEHVLEGQSAHSSTPHLGRNAIELALDRLAQSDVQGVAMLAGGSAVNQVPARCALRLTLARTAPASTARSEAQPSGGLASGARSEAQPSGALTGPVQSFDCSRLLGFHKAWREVCGALRIPSDGDFNPPHTVGNLGRVTLAEGVAEFSFDLRPVAGADVQGALAELGRFAKIECVRTNPALTTGANAALVESVRAAQAAVGLPQHVGTKATSTEAGLLAEAGVEALVIGPGVSVGNVHKPNEHTSIAQLAQARDLYREIARRLCVDVEAAACTS